ncbi:hypothetical protein NE236_00555 [Actinoallomurus purpureus]|nr:hypothetical protein [Actinoallomurus purpureus]MCO6003466.1 hypothetical protein [Actinoallomurus purpureus]
MFKSGSEGRAARQRAVLTRLLSPLLANIALSVLDEHLHGPWKPGGAMSTESRRATRRRKYLPNWRIVRYADDFVVMVHGTRQDTEAVREEGERRCGGRWPSLPAASSTTSRVRGATLFWPLSTRETVAIDSPVSSATCRTVARCRTG